VSVESPYNGIHLAIGGFDVPGKGDVDIIEGANGDMGENDTASFDPFFFFHHAFINYVFWLWQQKHNATTSLDVIPEYPSTNSVDDQGLTPGVPGNVQWSQQAVQHRPRGIGLAWLETRTPSRR